MTDYLDELEKRDKRIFRLEQEVINLERKYQRDQEQMWELLTFLSAKFKDMEDKTGFRVDREDIKQRLEEFGKLGGNDGKA